MNEHEGRRERLRERYYSEGLDNFAEHEVLELLLTFAIPRRDTNVLAHTLIEQMGSFFGVFESDRLHLQLVDGVGEHAALLINLVRDIGRRYLLSKFGERPILNTVELQAGYCKALQYRNFMETTYMICLSARKKVIATHKLDEGTWNNVPVYLNKIIQKSMAANTASVLFTHNHPGGDPMPSEDDILVTYQIIQALRTVDLKFEDHIIVGDSEQWVSLRESKCI